MTTLGFTYYDEVPVVTQPTTQEILNSLSGAVKLAILNGFANKIIPKTLAYEIKADREVIRYLYQRIDAVEVMSRAIMRGEVVVTPAVIEDGIEVTPAVYNEAPTTAAGLITQIGSEFENEFTAPQLTAILTKMVEYSKYDGTGDWDYYKTEVVK